MSRHPYTHAADYVRALGPVGSGGVVLSRADASRIIEGIASAIGMEEEQLAIKLSEAEQSMTQGDIERRTERLVKAVLGGRL